MPFQRSKHSASDEKHRVTPVGDAALGRVLRPLGAHQLVGIAAVIATAVALCAPSGAQAAYEQVPEHFGTQGEAAQLSESFALAVNQTGAGGVPPGTFYVIGRYHRVARYSPGKEGETPPFVEAWGWEAGVGSGDEYARCGPAYAGTASAAEGTYEKCTPLGTVPTGGGFELPGRLAILTGVAVDQTTGDVYVRNETGSDGAGPRQHHLIEIFSATGKLIGEGFGDAASGTSSPPESIAESPEKLHFTPGFGGGAMAVNASGTVYLTDSDYVGVGHPQNRVMSFEPCAPGDYEHYCYAAGKDIAIQENPTGMSLVGANRVVVASRELVDEYPVAESRVSPVCNLKVSGQLMTMTTNELTGEVFYFTFHDHSIHRMAPCDETSGTFTEDQTLKPTPQAGEIQALGVAPTLIWGPLRPPGVLYAVDAATSQPGIGDVFASVPASIAPTVGAESTTNTTSTSTVLEARIDPHGFPVTYYFEYLSQADYLANGESFEGPHPPARAPLGAGELEGGVGVASTVVTGLDPETEYRFRVIASSECNGAEQPGCVGTGPAARSATYPTTPSLLPDDRAYELVSPIEKHGGEVFPAFPGKYSCVTECKPPGSGLTTFPMQSTSDGDGVAYMGYPFSPTEGAAVYNSYVSRRSGSDWQTTAMSPALLLTEGGKYFAYSADLTEAVLDLGGPQLSPLAPAGYRNFYLQGRPTPSAVTPLLTTAPPHRATNTFVLEYEGHSADFRAQFFSADDALTRATPYAPEPPDPGVSGSDLYEWRDGNLTLVNVLPGGAAVAGGATFVSASPDANGVAADGRRVFWAAGGHVYDREDGQVTRELRHPGTFLQASGDGEEVLFTDGCLYSLLTEACTDLTQGHGGFLGIAGSTGDLSRIYFVDKAALTSEAEAGTCAVATSTEHQAITEEREESEGKVPRGLGCNLYAYEAGVGSTLVTTLLASDDSGAEVHDWASAPGERTAEASSDGGYLAFVSRAQLTGYGNRGLCTEHKNSAGVEALFEATCGEVFLYDAATKTVSCASCDPTGESPRGNSFLPLVELGNNFPQLHYLTNQGQLFFDSQDRLSPLDVNGRAEDVYEDEPPGVGSCTRTTSCVSLISPGTGAYDSNFLASGGEREGTDVFFTTRERLVPADKDELLDVYDARVEGGVVSEVEPGGCVGEACQATSGAPAASGVIFGPPTSMTFSGAGNLTLAAPVVTGKPKPQTRTQKLAKALTACRKKKPRASRLACEKTARRKYGVKRKPAENASSKARREGK